MHIPDPLTRSLLELDALLLGGTLRRGVRNYSGHAPTERDDGEVRLADFPRLARAIWSEWTLPHETYAHPCRTPRFIGATTGRSGTTWLKDVLHVGLGGTHLTVREIGFCDLAQFRGAPHEYLQYANLEQRGIYRRCFRDFILRRAFFIRRRIDSTLLGLCDLVPKRVVKSCLDHLDRRLEQARKLDEIASLGRWRNELRRGDLGYFGATCGEVMKRPSPEL